MLCRDLSPSVAACPDGEVSAFGKKRAREEPVVLLLVEPGAFDVEELQARNANGERERIDSQRRAGLLVRASGL